MYVYSGSAPPWCRYEIDGKYIMASRLLTLLLMVSWSIQSQSPTVLHEVLGNRHMNVMFRMS